MLNAIARNVQMWTHLAQDIAQLWTLRYKTLNKRQEISVSELRDHQLAKQGLWIFSWSDRIKPGTKGYT
jgi:hypothetical protein